MYENPGGSSLMRILKIIWITDGYQLLILRDGCAGLEWNVLMHNNNQSHFSTNYNFLPSLQFLLQQYIGSIKYYFY